MTDFLRRYRTSRGFGVHSPLAYELITGPLRDRRVAYYCFDSVVTPRARRLVRLAARLGADSVADISIPTSPALPLNFPMAETRVCSLSVAVPMAARHYGHRRKAC